VSKTKLESVLHQYIDAFFQTVYGIRVIILMERTTRLRLSLGKEFNANFDFGKIKNYDEKTKMVNGKQLDEKYIYIKIKRCLKKREITEVELKPIHKGTAFKICLKYNIDTPNTSTDLSDLSTQLIKINANRRHLLTWELLI